MNEWLTGWMNGGRALRVGLTGITADLPIGRSGNERPISKNVEYNTLLNNATIDDNIPRRKILDNEILTLISTALNC